MQPVLERGSIDKPLTFDTGLIFTTQFHTSLLKCSPITCSEIAPMVCTLVLFISAAPALTESTPAVPLEWPVSQ